MTAANQPDRPRETAPRDPADKPDAATPRRERHESNYGYETDHPSYKLRKAGDWSPPSAAPPRREATRSPPPEASPPDKPSDKP